MEPHRRHPAPDGAQPRLEVWLTGPDETALKALVAALEGCGAVLRSGPWNPLAGRAVQPERPWCAVLDAPAGIDPTLVAGVAHEHGCRYHPCGGAHRWDDTT